MVDLRTSRRWLPLPLTAAGLVVLAACGGGGDGPAPAATPTSAPETTASADAFAECMTEHGVPAPQGGTRITGPRQGEPGHQGAPVTRRNPPPAPDGVDPEQWEAALEACGPGGGRRTVGQGEGA